MRSKFRGFLSLTPNNHIIILDIVKKMFLGGLTSSFSADGKKKTIFCLEIGTTSSVDDPLSVVVYNTRWQSTEYLVAGVRWYLQGVNYKGVRGCWVRKISLWSYVEEASFIGFILFHIVL